MDDLEVPPFMETLILCASVLNGPSGSSSTNQEQIWWSKQTLEALNKSCEIGLPCYDMGH